MFALSLLFFCAIAVNGQFFGSRFYPERNFRENNDQNRFDILEQRISRLEKKMSSMQMIVHSDWNTTEEGLMYKVFEQRKNWEDAENFCQNLNSHLTVIENKKKNDLIKELIIDLPTVDFVWIGLKTKSATSSDQFANFDKESPINGCAVMDVTGVWSIRSCSQLRPFICQMNVNDK